VAKKLNLQFILLYGTPMWRRRLVKTSYWGED